MTLTPIKTKRVATLTPFYDLRINDKITLLGKDYIITHIATQMWSWSGVRIRDCIYGRKYTFNLVPLDFVYEAVKPSTSCPLQWAIYYQQVDRDRRRLSAATKVYESAPNVAGLARRS
jgi:hypothetical protein